MTAFRTGLLIVVVALVAAACDDSKSAPEDGGVPEDSAPVADVLPPDTFRGPWANVYESDPITDNKQTTEVLLTNLSGSKGELTGSYAEVWNCLPEPGGKAFNMGYAAGTTCHLRQKAAPGADGSYLDIKPPASDVSGDDSFAEVMMYHHINTIHDHYTSSFGITHLDTPIYAVVNLQFNTGGMWLGYPNAAFAAKESPGLLSMLGVPARDSIVFGLNNSAMNPMARGLPLVNYSYDAKAIYHEYTHYTLGSSVLRATTTPDKYGLSPTPLALNEGLADYLPASFANDPKLGLYALGSTSRDLTLDQRCPADLRGEPHRDGRIASGALWAARKLLGADTLDKAVWNAALTFTADTSFAEAAAAILDEVNKVAPDKHAAVKSVFEQRGFAGCVRLMEHKDFVADPLDELSAVRYAGPFETQTQFADGIPHYVQYRVAVQPTTKEITIVYRPEVQSYTGGVSRGNVWVALKPGSDPILYDYSSGPGTSDATALLQGADAGSDYKLVLSGDCLAPGDLVFQFVNKGINGGQIAMVKVTQSDTRTNTTDNFVGCTP